MRDRAIWLIQIFDPVSGISGYGECAALSGLSVDDIPDYQSRLIESLKLLQDKPTPESKNELDALVEAIPGNLPSVRFGVETALNDLMKGGKRVIFESDFLQGKPIEINGLIWMGDLPTMRERLEEKLSEGFRCIKFKIGAHDFSEELELLKQARAVAPSDKLEIRVDANGAYGYLRAKEVLQELAELNVHSIEQPISVGKWDEMADLCQNSPVDIALDEELIGIHGIDEKQALIESINPQYLIFKPNLLGGFKATEEWIRLSEARNIGWWMTSALESNIGLNAIAQFAGSLDTKLPQGLGTGGLYHNNIDSPLVVEGGYIHYDNKLKWDSSILRGFEQVK